MKRWIPEPLYIAKPWVFMIVGALLAIGMMLWSLWEGSWTPWRSLLCFVGAGSGIGGGIIFQLRQTYRQNNQWRRDKAGPR